MEWYSCAKFQGISGRCGLEKSGGGTELSASESPDEDVVRVRTHGDVLQHAEISGTGFMDAFLQSVQMLVFSLQMDLFY